MGEKVEKGQLIGKSGNTGASKGAHLHFEIRKDDSSINPMTFFNADGTSINTGSALSGEEDDDEVSAAVNNNKVLVATWQEVETNEVTTNLTAGIVENSTSETVYTATVTSINYQNVLSGYVMPFDYLWIMLIESQNKDFAFDLADTVYNSEIEFTVYDTLNINVDVTKKNYTKHHKKSITVSVNVGNTGKTQNVSKTIDEPVNYEYIKTVTTKTNTINTMLTKADVWMLKYERGATYSGIAEDAEKEPDLSEAEEVKLDDEGTSGHRTYANDDEEKKKIDEAKKEVKDEEEVKKLNELIAEANKNNDGKNTAEPIKSDPVSVEVKGVDIYYQEGDFDITQKTASKSNSSSYMTDPDNEIIEKIDEDTAPNFITLLKKREKAKGALLESPNIVIKLLEEDPYTKDLVDLTKYYFYLLNAKVKDPVTEYDFSTFWNDGYSGMITVEAGDFVVHTEMGDSAAVITDLETLKKAFSGYRTSDKLIQNAQYYLDFQNEYKVNAIFAAAVAIQETTAGTKGNAVNGHHNWYNIKGDGGWRSYSSDKDTIKSFYELIANGKYYFKQNNYTVKTIGLIYCEDAETTWIPFIMKHMSQMYAAVGINMTTGGTGNTIGGVSGGSGVVNSVNGDGYTQIYTVNGRNYKEFKQNMGSYMYKRYSQDTIATSGCGLTAASIVASGYGSTYNPGTLLDTAKKQKRVDNFRASPESTGIMLSTAGLKYTKTFNLTKSQLSSHLQSGSPAVLSVNNNLNGMFAINTHYIAILEISGDKVYVSNPNKDKINGWFDINQVMSCHDSARVAFLISNN